MSTHVFGALVTHHGTAANTGGENEGNTSTLQKLLWHGQTHTTVSAEAIRFALRGRLGASEPTNRSYNEVTRENEWKDPDFQAWSNPDGAAFIDDDLLGYMSASAAKDDAKKGSALVRRAVLEITRAVSTTPWAGDVSFNVASVGATPSAAKKGANPVPYSVEIHATRYQYGFALTPARLRVPARAATAITALVALGEVAGNHGRFLYDFSPDSAVFRVTDDPAPRLLYCFEERAGRLSFPALLARVAAGDIAASELIIGGSIVSALSDADRATLDGAALHAGVRAAAAAVAAKLGA